MGVRYQLQGLILRCARGVFIPWLLLAPLPPTCLRTPERCIFGAPSDRFDTSQLTDGGLKCLRRGPGKVERQFRMNIGELPIAYKTDAEGRYIYILDGALTSFENSITKTGVLVPPCITQSDPKTVRKDLHCHLMQPRQTNGFPSRGTMQVQILLGVEEVLGLNRSLGVQEIRSDLVLYTTRAKVGTEEFVEEVIKYFQEVLAKRCGRVLSLPPVARRDRIFLRPAMALPPKLIPTSLSPHLLPSTIAMRLMPDFRRGAIKLLRGPNPHQKILQVEHAKAEEVYPRLLNHIQEREVRDLEARDLI